MSTDAKRLSALAVGSCVAFGVSSWVYESWIIPRLPTIDSVPTSWWIGTYVPVLLIVAAAGATATSLRKVPTYSFAVFVPPTLLQVARGLITGAPVMHDVWVGDWNYWVLKAIQFALCTAAIGLAYAVVRARPLRWLSA